MWYIFLGGEVDYIGWMLINLEVYGFEVYDVEGWWEYYVWIMWLWVENLIV